MIFRRKQDEMEGFRRMREALRQQADPQDHALLDDDQYGTYDEEDAELADGEELEDEAMEEGATGGYEPYSEPTEADPAVEGAVAAPVQAAAPDLFPRPHHGGPSMTTIGADSSWSGTLRSESDVYVEGRVDGTLEVRDTVYIAERATIDAKIKARSVVVSGEMNGDIDCDGRLEITPTGRLTGTAEVGSIVVHEGAVLDGKFKMKSNSAIASR